MLFFRDQTLTHDEHKALGRQFGELAIHSGVAGIEGHPEIVAIHSDANSKYVAGENWHSDLTCNAEPPMGSILYLKTVPETGGDTVFASMYAAYDALSDRMKAYVDGMSAVHDGEHVYRHMTADPTKRFPCNAHPDRAHASGDRPQMPVRERVLRHPYRRGAEGREQRHPRIFVRALHQPRISRCASAGRPMPWCSGTIACTQHLAVWDYYPQTRSGFRVTVAGDKPF